MAGPAAGRLMGITNARLDGFNGLSQAARA